MAKVLEFQLQHHSFQRNPRVDLLQNGLVGSPCSPRDCQESSPTPQVKSINSSALSFLWRRQWHPTPVLLPGKSHGWRRLVGCSPWGRKESDMTERLHFHFSLSCTGEGNGNPLQCSCLENPRDGGAWWAAVYGNTQSWTRLSDLAAAVMLGPKYVLKLSKDMGQ